MKFNPPGVGFSSEPSVGLLKAIEEPDESDLVGKAKSVMRAPAPAELHEIFLGRSGGPLELVAGKHS